MTTEIEATSESNAVGLRENGMIYAGPLRNGLSGIQVMYRFPNGYGASIIRGGISYGRELSLWELAVIRFGASDDGGWDFAYDTDITDDVEGYLSPPEVDALLERIVALPKRAGYEITAA